MLHPSLSSRIPLLAQAFARREPFRHVLIDDFFAEDFLARVLAEFPDFDQGNARNEAGELGHKSTVEGIRELGPAFAELDQQIQSRGFLDLISAITGIPDLLYDPHYFGGGTHENRPGQDLDAHVDFNRHPINGWHRRLNLIVYLNPEWDDAWGGSLELHSDPRSEHDQVTVITPLMNRAVIFETTEWSWHGFSRIAPPAERQRLSRRSIALYFYSRERPEEELAQPHSTIYVDRPVDCPLQAGHTLSADDAEQIRIALARRDQHVQRLYGDITRLTSELDSTKQHLDRIVKSGLSGHLRRLARRLLNTLSRN
ncbi:MAG: 2OG-Fe(II) oxygenase [Rhodanobacteraceae bacterium]|nr:2OG-Fe(II) oxygenase [Rhodanobacteraceae bacterium]